MARLISGHTPIFSVKVNNGALQKFKVEIEDVTIVVNELGVPTGVSFFFLRDEASDLLRRAMREELSVRVTIPIYQNVPQVFEWDMKGGAAAYKQACRTIRPEGRAHKRNSSGL